MEKGKLTVSGEVKCNELSHRQFAPCVEEKGGGFVDPSF